MKYELPEKTQALLCTLIQQATEDGVIIAGFAFKVDPSAVTNFGNCTDRADLRLYDMLCKFVDEKKKAGLVEVTELQKPV